MAGRQALIVRLIKANAVSFWDEKPALGAPGASCEKSGAGVHRTIAIIGWGFKRQQFNRESLRVSLK